MARELEDEVDVLTRKEVKEFHIEQEADVKQKEIEAKESKEKTVKDGQC